MCFIANDDAVLPIQGYDNTPEVVDSTYVWTFARPPELQSPLCASYVASTRDLREAGFSFDA